MHFVVVVLLLSLSVSEKKLITIQYTLEVRGRARCEAARRCKSEWKVNLGIPNSSRSNGSWQMTQKTVSFSIVEPCGIWTCVS